MTKYQQYQKKTKILDEVSLQTDRFIDELYEEYIKDKDIDDPKYLELWSSILVEVRESLEVY